MNRKEMMAIEHSIAILNEIIKISKIPHKPFKIIWNTSLGLSTLNLVKYHPSDETLPILKANYSHGYFQYDISSFTEENHDIFSFVRHAIINYFYPYGKISNIFLIENPDSLLNKIIELSKECAEKSLLSPDYTNIWNFESLDQKIKLPFISSNKIEVFEPISLISEN
ncbi:hypothetical protein [Enterococcus sp. AZ152]|uniref:hypothetical protein n=1 Tax=Enterococcus sp. AZ152 TaxID=2774848 RepID=UPI003F1F1B96